MDFKVKIQVIDGESVKVLAAAIGATREEICAPGMSSPSIKLIGKFLQDLESALN